MSRIPRLLVQLLALFVFLSSSDSIPLAAQDDFRTPREYVIEAHGPDGTLAHTLTTLTGRRFGSVESAPNFKFSPMFDGEPDVDAGGTTIAITPGRDPEVRLLDEQFRVSRIIRWIDEDREATRADVRAWREEYIRQQRGRDFGDYAAILGPQVEAIVSDDRPVADLFPAASSVMVARDGRIWVRRYRRPQETTRWLAFEPDGRFLCHLDRIPGLENAYEFGADYILGSRRDALDIESVVMYELSTPAPPR